jgi:3-oxoacyl-[acyl-carrier-protein] synthase-1
VTVFLSAPGLVCALGADTATVGRALLHEAPRGLTHREGPTPLGAVDAALPDLSGYEQRFHSRNNQLLVLAVEQLRGELERAIATVGAARVGCMVGTSTSGIGEAELALDALVKKGALPAGYHYGQQELGNPALFAAQRYGLGGPTTSVSTACTSSAKALASAARMLASGAADVVLAGGVDSLCGFTVAGFGALEAVSAERCNPLSRNRRGINLGEAAAFFLVTKAETAVRLAGWGETSDAHHMSAPDPTGVGARAAMERALGRAQVTPDQVDYVNLHGTATAQNDAMESRAVGELLGTRVPVSSTKPLTGHTLGAAGALEAGFSWLTLEDDAGRLPPHLWDGEVDPALPPLTVVTPGMRSGKRSRVVVSNSFAFGGNNVSLVFVRA